MTVGSALATTTVPGWGLVCEPEKFPGGLDELIGNVNALGMDFGLWVGGDGEPDSDLYRAHRTGHITSHTVTQMSCATSWC